MARPATLKSEIEEAKQKGYKPLPGDEFAVHVRVQKPPLFDVNTGKPTGTDFIQKYEPRSEWPEFVLRSQGYVIHEVLFLPEGAKTIEEIKEADTKKIMSRRR